MFTKARAETRTLESIADEEHKDKLKRLSRFSNQSMKDYYEVNILRKQNNILV
jgi:hypothetical protein